MTNSTLVATIALLSALSGPAFADQSQGQDPAPAAAASSQPAQPSDRAVNPSQPDFTIIALPTTLRIPRFGSAFRVTHRFTRQIDQGDFGDFLDDFFGFDSNAQIGLEYRFGLMAGLQAGVYRTSDRAIQLFGQRQMVREGNSPVGIDALVAVEGANNFQENYATSVGALVSRNLGRHGAVYAEPIWVGNSNPRPSSAVDHNSTFMLGLGARVRVLSTVYLIAEVAPRWGFTPGVPHASFAIEKRAGGHSFQLNLSNSLGTTLAQVARGGFASDTWYIGFNISRKFF